MLHWWGQNRGCIMTHTSDSLVATVAFVVAAWINADAAVGAAFGSAFFLLNAEQHPMPKRLAYACISAGVGYGAGVAAGGSWTLLVSAATAAIGVVALTSVSKSIETEGLGALRTIFEIIRGRKG